VELELEHTAPLDGDALLAFFRRRAVPGVEEIQSGVYRRSLHLAEGPGVLELWFDGARPRGRLRGASAADAEAATVAARRLLDLDADPAAIDAVLGDCPLIGSLRRAAPGLRVPGHPDPPELAVRAVIGQQVSVAGAATVAGRLVAAYGDQLAQPVGSVTHLFPVAGALAGADPEALPMPRARSRALTGLAAALAAGEVELDPGRPARARAALLARPGIGPWTADYVAMRALGDRNAFLPTDLGVRRALEALGEDGSPAHAAELAERWRPFRAYALQHLWSTLQTKERRIR